MTLDSLGWDGHFENAFQPYATGGFVPARVVLQHKHACQLLSADGELTGTCTGRLLHGCGGRGGLPAVGDWVAVRLRTGGSPPRPGERPPADIHGVLPRRTKFSRRAAGEAGEEQVIAANIDTALLVTALDQNYNLRRIERYLTATRESGAAAVVVLNKADLHPDPEAACAEVAAISGGAPVVALSAAQGAGLAALKPWLLPCRTMALLGSSGAGKSTLVNRLLGTEYLTTGALSEAVGKGRHTTTRRELIVIPGGALLIDTPGMRELQLWDPGTDDIDETFADVTATAARCRFSDCTHNAEPGCALQAALDDGSLSPARWESFQKLRREQAWAARRESPELARETRDQWKRIHKQARARMRMKRDYDD